MFYKYPYTNLYNLNLDWLIQAVKELQEIVEPLENVVTSVNGMTGNVELTREILTQILGGMVSKFNGRDGDVTLTAEDVNETLIDITWTSDPGDTIDDLTQTQLDDLYTSGKRVLIFVNNLGVADQVYFLQYYDNHAMPQEYSPTSALAGVATFNGQTGNVTATGADLATSGTDQTTIAANLANLENTKVPNTRTVNNKPLSTNISINAEDIPSQAITGATDVEMALGNLNNSKVPNSREVNNKSLITSITLNDEDIPSQVVSGQTTVEGVLTDLDTRVSNQSQQIANKQDELTFDNTPTAGSTNPVTSDGIYRTLFKSKLLWTNPNITQQFPAQTINIDISSYKFIIICYADDNNGYYENSHIYPNRQDVEFETSRTTLKAQWRNVTFADTSVIFTDALELATYGNINTRVTNNNVMRPRFIYGIK